MCTSLTYTDTDQHHYFGRTMDFPTTTPWRPIFLPRGYRWPTGLNTKRTTRYALLGGGRLPVHFASCLMADGVNEHGLACAELYLPHAVTYHHQAEPGRINLTPQGFINWVLGEHASVADVQNDLDRVCLVAAHWGGDDQVYPFHWYLSDQTGASVVIEPTSLTLHAVADPIGVLTNTPTLPQHVHNLARTLNVTDPHALDQLTAAAHAWLKDARPLPNGPVPTDRFVKMALLRLGNVPGPTATTPTTLFKWLKAVSLPFEPAKQNCLSHNYTHYQAVIDLCTHTYYFRPRNAHQARVLQLTPSMATNWSVPFIFKAD